MLITSYNYAHELVSKNSSLFWNGWDIVEFRKNQSAEYDVAGKRIDESWGFTKTFPITEKGWEVPERYVR
jgi:hypothetical protein